MPIIQQIPSLVQSKSMAQAVRPADQNTEIFTLDQFVQTKAVAAREEGERESSFGDGGARSEKIPVAAAKDPALTGRMIKSLLSEEVLSGLARAGSSVLTERLSELGKALFLSTDRIQEQIQTQQGDTTAFKGEFFDALRPYVSTQDTGVRAALAAVLKAYTQMQSQGELLQALSGNLGYLAGVLVNDKELSAQLFELSARFAQADAAAQFPALSRQTQNLLPAIDKSLQGSGQKGAASVISMLPHTLSRFGDNPSYFAQSMDKLLSLLPDGADKQQLLAAYARFLPALAAQAPEDGKPQAFPAFARMAELLSERLVQPQYSNALQAQNLPDRFGHALERLSAGRAAGLDTLKSMLSALLPGGDTAMLAARVMRELSLTGDLKTLIGNLNLILRSIPEDTIRQAAYEGFMGVISQMRESGELPLSALQTPAVKTPAHMLADFLAANTDAISSAGFQTQTLLSSLLSSPGALTPLMHLLLPVEYQNRRTYGELWVEQADPYDGGKNGGGDSTPDYHLFLTFEIESVGSFELDVYARGESLSAALMTPPEFTGYFESLRGRLGKSLAGTGYTMESMTVRPLAKKHDLLEIFPSVAKRRSGLSVKV